MLTQTHIQAALDRRNDELNQAARERAYSGARPRGLAFTRRVARSAGRPLLRLATWLLVYGRAESVKLRYLPSDGQVRLN